MAATTTVTFIRHGESEDNLNQIWGGWNDSPLSEFGRKQAQALGRSLSSTHITHFYTSPLLRAHATAQLVHHYQPHPKPPLQLNFNLREQYFGIAEGHPWTANTSENKFTTAELYQQKIFPALYGRDEKFPEGESLDDLAVRAEAAIRECVLPHVQSTTIPLDSEPDNLKQEEESGRMAAPVVHVALASHGNCISELVSALLRLDPKANWDGDYFGLVNTAWMRMEILVRNGHYGPIDPANPPPLEVRVTHVNQKEHLDSLETDPTPHVEPDGVSEKAKAFFAGTGIIATEKESEDKVDEISKAIL